MASISSKYRSVLLRSAVPGLILSFMAANTAQAQIETVVVTAEKRAENVQNVPIAITAFTGTTLQDKNITDLHGLSNLTPNVNLDGGAPFSGDSSVLSASIRGIGQDRKSTRLNSSHVEISYAVFCLKKKTRATKSNMFE